MAITFIKDVNGKIIVDKDGVKYSLNASMNIIAHPADEKIIIITDSSAPLETREVFRFGWEEVTVPVVVSRNDLVEKLGKNFFYESVSVILPPGFGTGDTGVQTTVSRSATSVTLLALNVSRNEAHIRNESNVAMYIAFGATATVGKGIKLEKNERLIEDKYTGIITAIWASAGAGSAEIIEVT